jgi:LacI family transcriptional regulator
MVTIKDVAKRAKVSITSASYALNETGTISTATRKRILEAAEALNYHPNAFARNLKKRKTHSIGVFISRFGGSFYEDILEGIHDAALKTSYELIVCPESQSTRKIFTQRLVDGAIVFDSKISSELIIKLAAKNFPIIVLDRFVDAEFIQPLLVDNQQGVREAFYHLYNQGARKIYFISGALDSLDNQERTAAFLSEATKNNVMVRCFNGNFTEESGHDVAMMIIASSDLPEAVFCANDQMAIGFIRGMKENNLKAPDDIAVVGFDDILIARYMQPTLSTVGTSRFEWGSLAAIGLIDYLEYNKPLQPLRINTWFIPRESSSKNSLALKDN